MSRSLMPSYDVSSDIRMVVDEHVYTFSLNTGLHIIPSELLQEIDEHKLRQSDFVYRLLTQIKIIRNV